MRAGLLRHRITIESFTEGANEYGEPISTWATYATVWASKEDLSGREYFASQQINAEVSTKFRIRYRAGITAKMRIQHGGSVYQIAATMDPDGRKRTLEILASKVG